MSVSRKDLADNLRGFRKTFKRRYKKGVSVDGYARKGDSIVVTTFGNGTKKVNITTFVSRNKKRKSFKRRY